MISFVIPAYNEEWLLARTLQSLLPAAQAAGEPFEVIVVNDSSTDRTREIALSQGVRVIDVQLRKISAVRNAGARQAKGELLFFLDADTLINAQVIRDALDAMRAGCVGGGAWVRFEQAHTPWAARVFAVCFARLWFSMNWAAGGAFFARREDFQAVGGFDERYFASEELHLSRALKRRGKFRILRSAVLTSSRKVRIYTVRELLGPVWRVLFGGLKAAQNREAMNTWYDGRREGQPHNAEEKEMD